ncbi:MAG: class A beta-lactamase-related serine hydrolase [Microbacteriaceae bacterium]|nr:MAG: class A beta-lactamase-related serine hydrolase [Microbacteriaceae bacterium]
MVAMSRFDNVWRSLEATVASGWAPGIVAGVRHDGTTEFFATGVRTLGGSEESDAMRADTPFRIASLSKPIGGALASLLIADGVFGLDDPIDRWLPELAHPRVLLRPDAPLDQTVAADRPITVRHLLTLTHGQGVGFGRTPLTEAIEDLQIGAGPIPPQLTADEYLARLGSLPLTDQPGTRWRYNTGSDILSVLMARASGRPLRELLADRITRPLGMGSTGFTASAELLPTAYQPAASGRTDPDEPDGLAVFDEPGGFFSKLPPFETLAAGLVSTAPDYLAFLAALEDDGLLPTSLRAQMTSDQLTSQQREGADDILGAATSWGWQVSVELRNADVAAGRAPSAEPWRAPGRYGWTGGSGVSAYVDPSRDLIGVVFTQRLMSGPLDTFSYFWAPLAAALS